MSNYEESKRTIDALRRKYSSGSDVILRTAILTMMDAGQNALRDEETYRASCDEINARYDKAKTEGKILFVSREFELDIIECAKELSQIEPADIIMYLQRELWFGGHDITYQRAIALLQNTLSVCVDEAYESDYALHMAREIGFMDDEIEELGYGFMLDCEREDEDGE